MASERIKKINPLIKQELSQIILREIDFPSGFLVTLTRVETSKHLRESNIWISIIPEKETKRILEILNKKSYFLQQKLGERLEMKLLPRIKFLEEKKTSEAAKIEEILEGIEKRRKMK